MTASAIESEKVSTGSKAHKLKTPGTFGDTANQVSTQKTPPLPLHESVNGSEMAPDKRSDCKKRVFQEVLSEVDSLSEQIKQFLQSKGIEVYKIQLSQEAYQVKHKGQIIRLYVQRKQTGVS